jgi:hypothetical protein
MSSAVTAVLVLAVELVAVLRVLFFLVVVVLPVEVCADAVSVKLSSRALATAL